VYFSVTCWSNAYGPMNGIGFATALWDKPHAMWNPQFYVAVEDCPKAE